jgi:hypothetical protein
MNIVKVYEGVVVKLHRFLTSALDGISGQLHALPLGSCGKSLWYPLNRKADGHVDALEKSYITCPFPASRLAISLVTMCTELSGLWDMSVDIGTSWTPGKSWFHPRQV